MKERVKKLFRGGTAVLLSLAMALSVFMGMELEAKAAGGLYCEAFTPPSTYAELEAMCFDLIDLSCSEVMQVENEDIYPEGVTVVADISGLASGLLVIWRAPNNSDSAVISQQSDYADLLTTYPPSSTDWHLCKRSSQPVPGGFVRITDAASIEKLETLYSPDAPYRLLLGDPMLDAYPADAVFVLLFWKGDGLYMQGGGTPNSSTMDELKAYLKQALSEGKPIYIWVSDEPSASEKSTKGAGEAHVHTHSYSWVTVQEASSQQDGIEEYRCSCGDVQERNIIPASEVLIKGFYGEIKNAPQGGTASFDTGRQYTLSDYIIRKLSERADVTTVITFEYEGQVYRMTIPAGADYTQLLADEAYFYGYFYFANAVGAVIEAI